MPFAAPKFLAGFVEYGPILMTKYRLFVLVTTALVLVLFWAFLAYTPYGRIIRAGSRDPEMVGLLGINLPIVLHRRVRHRLPARGSRRDVGRAAVDHHALDGCRRHHAGLRDRDHRRPRLYPGAIVAGLLVGITTAMTIQFQPDGRARPCTS